MPKILNIAHRGFHKEFPDNTLEAFFAAIKLKADGIECDVHETADHHFVIFHDDQLLGRNIGDLSLKEIGKVRLAQHYQIPTLEETLDLCHTHVRVMLELKQLSSLDLFTEIISVKMMPDELFVTSFKVNLINQLAAFVPQIQRGILTGLTVADPINLMETSRTKLILPQFPFTTAELVKSVHSHHLSIIVWDCNNTEDMRTALLWGVDGIITDAPDVLAQEISNQPQRLL